VLDLASRRVTILGSTRHPDATFMHPVVRAMVAADDGPLAAHRVLLCDRDATWSAAVREQLADAGLHVVQTPYRAPNANAHAERFVRTITEECRDRLIPLGDRHVRQAIAEFVAHDHHERPHPGRNNTILLPRTPAGHTGRLRCHRRLGELLTYYTRAA
jgi:transposase InsO family protein